MKKITASIVFITCLIFISGMLFSNSKIQSNIASGKYEPKINVSIGNMRKLPVPSTYEDYSFLQCIGTECNYVEGKFSANEREILLYKDTNSDGKVDFVVHWFVDKKRPKYEARPEKFCSPAQFKKLKQDLLEGKQGAVSKNLEGIDYLRVIMKNSENVKKWRQGFTVSKHDLDDPTLVRVKYSFSYNQVTGADLVFEVVFRHLGAVKESPVINQYIYCKDSKDPFVVETVKQLIKETTQYYASR